MKNKILLAFTALLIILSSTACFDNSKQQPEQTETIIRPAAAAIAETKEPTKISPEFLYPAFVMEDNDKKWGYIDESGSFIVKPEYDSADDFKENGLAKVTKKNKYGLIDKHGKYIAKLEYDYINEYKEGTAVASDGLDNSFLLDEKGGVIFKTEGFIGEMGSGGLAPFSKKLDRNKHVWGYVSSKGEVVIEPKYENAGVVKNGRAVVKTSEGHYSIIDNKGKTIKELQEKNVYGLSEDTIIFSKDEGNYKYTYGYMSSDGNVLIAAKFSSAGEFQDGVAVVSTSKEFWDKYGVINKNGEFVMAPQYPQITYLGKGIFAVPIKSEYSFNIVFSKKALFSKVGKQLTEYKYYDLEMLDNGLISANDDKNTLLIDKEGNEVKSFPKLEGIGRIKQSGRLLKADIDNGLIYIDNDGKIIWKSDNTLKLEGGIEVKKLKFRPDRCTYIEYPEFKGITDLKIQEQINGELKKKFIDGRQASNKEGEMYTEDVNIEFVAQRNKDLLIVSESGYYYPIGAAHGQPSRDEHHINIKSGRFYSVEDLFLKGSDYEKKLTEIVKKKIKRANDEAGSNMYSEEISLLGKATGFKVNKDSLQIYFSPYEIAAYAAGFPEFEVAYEEIMDIIDTEGEFWKSFEREKSPEKPVEEISPVERTKLEEAMKGYEKTMMEAIGKNDFGLVEPWLYPDSSLYNSQKKLVENLNKQGIKEKLESYSIKGMKSNNRGNVFRIYVTENVSIQYPGKDYVTKQFDWVYSMCYSYEDQRYRLTFIEKWDGK